MDSIVYDTSRYYNSIRNWWTSLAMGIIFIGAGIYLLAAGTGSYFVFTVVFGIMIILSGLLEIFLGINNPPQAGRGWLIAAGSIEILLGALLLSIPYALLVYTPFLLGFWLMFRGFTMIGVSGDMIGYGIRSATVTLAVSILTVIASLFVIANPLIGWGTMMLWLAVAMLLAGCASIVQSVHLERMKKYMDV